MKEIKKLEKLFLSHKISRRTFISQLSLIGATAVIPSFLTSNNVLAATPKKGGRFRLGMAGGAITDSLEPGTFTDHVPIAIQWQIKNNLVEIDASGNSVPELAESWEPSADAVKWVFKVRKGVEFHNGKTLDAKDVLYSLNYHRGEKSKSAGKALLESVADIKVDDSETILITLKSGNADFPFYLASEHFPIIPAGDQEFSNGTGGYKIVSYEPGVRVVTKRNPNYWKAGRAHFDEIETIIINDTVSRTTALKSGTIDTMNRCDLKTVNLLGKMPGIKVIRKTGALHYYFPMRTDTAPFNNKDVRLAIKYAVDREQLLDKVLRGYGAVGNDHPIGPTYRYYASNLPQRKYNPDKAKHYIKKAGMQDHVFKLHASDAAFSGGMDAAILIQGHMAKAGINMKVIKEPSDGYWSNVWMKKPWSMSFMSGRPTEDWVFSLIYAAGAPWNDSFWDNKRFNKLLVEARVELDESKRRKMYEEMQSLIKDDGGVLLPMFADNVDAGNKKIKYDKLAGNYSLDGLKCCERWWFES